MISSRVKKFLCRNTDFGTHEHSCHHWQPAVLQRTVSDWGWVPQAPQIKCLLLHIWDCSVWLWGWKWYTEIWLSWASLKASQPEKPKSAKSVGWAEVYFISASVENGYKTHPTSQVASLKASCEQGLTADILHSKCIIILSWQNEKYE